VATQEVYGNYRHDSDTYQELSLRIKGYVKEKRIDLVVKMCANMLEESCFDLVKKLAGLKRGIESLGVGHCCLSGSGSAMFCIIEANDEEIARVYKRQIDEMSGFRSIIVSNNRW
jgi:pentatricopeptide repeat protein